MVQVRVLIMADDPLARAGLALLLAAAEGCQVVGQISRTADVSAALDIYQPTAAIFDWGWEPAAAAAELELLDEFDIPVIVLLPDGASPALAAAALTAGAYGVLQRQASGKLLAAALSAVASGLIVLDPTLAAEGLSTATSIPLTPETLPTPLTPREVEVLHHLAQGLTNKAIAQALNISPHTVKFHITAIMTKLNAQSRTEAVILATRHGLLPL